MKYMNLLRCAALAALLTTVLGAGAQQTVTKSGTPVTPAPREAAAALPKQASPLPQAEARPVYIAVCPADLAGALDPLLQWRRQQGYQVEVICPSTYKRDSIRQQLMERYQNASLLQPAQKYVLLAGDVDRIQAFLGKHTPNGLNGSVTDLYYGEYTGDYLPEAAVGRLPAADSAELALMAAKIIDYEQGRWAAEQQQLLLAAGKEEAALALTTTNGQVNYLAQLAAANRPALDTACFYNPSSDSLRSQLVAALDQGNALVNYTAHCTRAGWSSPSVNARGIDTLQHDTPTIYVNNCCLSNAYDGTCFGEQLMRMAGGGAAAVIGATNETLWQEDFYWAAGAKYPPSAHPQYDSLRPGAFDPLMLPSTQTTEEGCTLGDLLQAGCRAVSQAGSVYDAFYWETYCLLGDPATRPYMGTADTLTLTLLDTLRAGTTRLHLAATPGCRISATTDTLLLGSTLADAQGEAWLELALPDTADTLRLTATRHDARPTTITAAAMPATEARLAATAYHLTEGTEPALSARIRNIGSRLACRHTITVQQDSTDRAGGCTMETTAPLTLTLAAGEDTLLRIPLGELHPGCTPLLHARLVTADSTGEAYGRLHIVAETDERRPLLTTLQIADSDGCAVRQLVPGRRYRADYVLANPADSVTWGGDGVRWEAEAWFTVTADSMAHLAITPHKEDWQQTYEYYYTCYQAVEDFETGLQHYPWQTNTIAPWQPDSTACHHGSWALRSGTVGDNQQSELTLDLEAACDDTLSFWLNVQSEAGDFLNFYVDGRRNGWWSGSTGWKQWVCPLTAGQHRLRWSYQKNASQSERSDCAWIDDLQLPFCRWTAPYGISSGLPAAAIPATANEETFSVRPNPASGAAAITLTYDRQAEHIALYDPLGRLADKIFLAPGSRTTQYSTTHLRYGIYTLVLYDEKQQPIATQKLIVTAP